MANKSLKIDNLNQDYFQELSKEEISSLQGGMVVEMSEYDEKMIIEPDKGKLLRPYYPLPYPCNPYPIPLCKYDKPIFPHCPVIL